MLCLLQTSKLLETQFAAVAYVAERDRFLRADKNKKTKIGEFPSGIRRAIMSMEDGQYLEKMNKNFN
jgi:hypothetical protein